MKIATLLTLLACCLPVQAATVKDFARHPEFYNVKISPDGKHLAVLINHDNRKTLAFMRTDNYQLTYVLNASGKDQAGSYYWVNNERVLLQIEQMRGALEKPQDYGELFGINLDGEQQKMLFGYRTTGGIKMTAYAGHLLARLPKDDRNVLINKTSLDPRTGYRTEVVKLNVYNGREVREKVSPIGYNTFLVDNQGIPRFVAGKDDNDNIQIYYSDGKGERWQQFSAAGNDFEPLTFAADNQHIYALKGENGQPKGLYLYDLQNQSAQLLYQSKIADPTYAINADVDEVYGLRMDEDYPTYLFLREDLPESKIHKALVQAFHGSSVEITSRTDDGSLMVIHVSSDRNPGQFYLFDTKTMQAKFLVASMGWIKPEEMNNTEAFRINTADGYALTGYLTLPKGSDGKNLPTVVMPHGGPHARDYWGFDPYVQLLASQGYAVVQVNFRGSDGFGEHFLQAGYGEWGGKIQDDIYAATQYAIQSGVANAAHICIAGGSFGGYSALQSAIRYPDTYKCAIGYAGVYDLPLLCEDGDIQTVKWGGAFLNKTLGTDVSRQKAMSPAYHVDKLKAALLIVHGEDDERAPLSQAEALKKALDAQHYPYEWLVKPKEGHGFYNEANIEEFFQRSLDFLKKNI